MTARFGRNKRRAAREAVARAEAAAAAAKAETERSREFWQKRLYDEQRARHDAQAFLADICERIIRAFGEQSALLPIPLQVPRELKMGERFGVPIRWPTRNRGEDLDGFALAEPRASFYAIQDDMYVRLQEIVISVTESPEYARVGGNLIRFMGAYGHREGSPVHVSERAYFASANCLRELGPELDFRYFAEEIAHQLLTLQRPEQRR